MRIGIIDADLIGRKKHRFPNLASEKISAYWKEKGADVVLKLDYDHLEEYEHVYISKVFTDTPIPKDIVETDRIHMGGTGFYFDKAPNLQAEIEHHMPDYNLYDKWIDLECEKAKKEYEKQGKNFVKQNYIRQFKEYTDYSIGNMTRGCFRKCEFCVNKKYDKVYEHSPLEEFYDSNRKKICLLDDNFFGCQDWKQLLQKLIDTNRPFKFKQGLDERLLTEEKCELLFNAKYDGDYTFAFDSIRDYDIIHSKLRLIRKYTSSINIKFYVLVGFESVDESDIVNIFKRIELLMRFKCLPYIMRYQNRYDMPWKNSNLRELYISIARWTNQPGIFKKMSFRQFCEANQELHKTKGTLCSAMRAMTQFEKENPAIAKEYFDLRYETHYLKNEVNDRWNT